MGFWVSKIPNGSLRIGALLTNAERKLPSESVLYREALVAMLRRLEEARAAALKALGWDPPAYSPASDSQSRASHATRMDDAAAAAHTALSYTKRLLRPYQTARFAPFAPLQPGGAGRLPNGSSIPTAAADAYNAAVELGWERRGRTPASLTAAAELFEKPGGKCAVANWVVSSWKAS